MKQLLAIAISAALSQAALADSVAINNVVIEKGDNAEVINVLVEDGVIKSIGTKAYSDAKRIIDGEGAMLTPGFIMPYGSLGLVEISAVKSTNNSSTADWGAAMTLEYAVNPDSTHLPLQRKYGVTSAIAVAGGELFNGSPLYFALDSDATIRDANVGQNADLGNWSIAREGGSRAAALKSFKKALNDAIRLDKNDDYADNESSYSMEEAQLKALLPAASGDKPLAVYAQSAHTIRHLLAIAEDLDLDLIIVGGAEAWRVADELAEAGVPVALDGFANLPADFDQIGSRLDNAALLDKAGVSIMFSTSEPYTGKITGQMAGNAVAHGLSYQAATKALTSNVAKAWGLEDIGEIKEGYTADLVLWSGDPLELSSQPTMVMIDGEIQSTETRSDKLAQRYLDISNDDRAYTHK